MLIIVALILISIPSAILGAFLSFQRKALLSDAMSHSLLGGIGFAFFIFGSKSLPFMLLGAVLSGIATTLISQKLSNLIKIPFDTALGAIFPIFFSLGVLLVSWSARDVDLDPSCILYGLIEFIPLDTVNYFNIEFPRAYLTIVPTFFIIMSLIFIFRKEIKLAIFDPEYSRTILFNPKIINLALIILTSILIVVGFEAVGSILIISLLITPSATAGFITNSYNKHLFVSAIIATVSAIVGYELAVYFNTSIAGMVSVIHGIIFLLAIFFAPKDGFIFKFLRQVRLSFRITVEDTIADLYRLQKENGYIQRKRKVGFYQMFQTYSSDLFLLASGFVVKNKNKEFSLTEKGLTKGAKLIRAHRLWESYLSKNFVLPQDHLHDPAERMEHYLSELITEELALEIGAKVDPHGKVIPG